MLALLRRPATAAATVASAAAIAAAALVPTLAARPAAAQNPDALGRTDRRATVAVLYFTNGALMSGTDYAPLSKGMAEMLITTLAQNPGVRVVERDRLQQLIAEQNLGSGDRVDKETAIRLGRVLGAHHLLMGTFVIDPKQNMRIDVRSVNTETSQIEYVETVSGKADRMLAMVDELGTKVNTGLKLPDLPVRLQQTSATPEVKQGGANQFRAVMLVSRALERQDRGDKAGAIALYKEALQAYPNFERAKTLLAAATIHG